MADDDPTDIPLRRSSDRWELVMFAESGPCLVTLPRDGEVLVGRGASADIRIDHATISREHARILLGREPRLEDLGSSNGTTLAGNRLEPRQPRVIGHHAVVGFGEVFAVLREAHDDAVPPSVPEGSMEAVRRLVDLVAPSDLHVLLLGETGVGKEVLSTDIHQRSKRAGAAFLRVNCASLSEQLLESELFGHERGAFTGAVASKQGLLEAAHRGTVLLDEVGELPPSIQAKLLRVLESGEFMRVGSTEPRTVDVRFLAATNSDLPSMVRQGSFRADLFFRLDGITIHVPPLRERRDEIVPLARQFAAEACKRMDRSELPFEPRALELLRTHAWPGNVRELRKVVERAVVLCRTETIGPEHLLGLTSRARASSEDLHSRVKHEREELERQAIEKALAEAAGNQTSAARILGISRRMLVERLDRFGFPRPRKK